MKQSQITIFIVLGIVVMIIFGLVYFVSRQTSDIVLEKKINKIYGDFLSATNIKHIADGCLDRATKEALLLVGLQGGRIYDYQIKKGFHINSFYDAIPYNYTGQSLLGVIYNVSYGVRAPINVPHPEPPEYPCNGSLAADVFSLSISSFLKNPDNQLFAEVGEPGEFTLLPDLCNKFGPNYGNLSGAKISCETYSIKNESVQEYMQEYIKENVKECINFTFNATSKYNISTKDLSLTVLMGEDDILVSLDYPLEISIKNKPPITKYLNFNTRPRIRIKMLHEIANHLLGFNPALIKTYSDSNNILFNILKDDPNDCYGGRSKCILEGEINVFKLRDYCLNNNHCNFNDSHYNYSDILVIEDNKSIIDGKPYRFQFAMENRRPALDLIDESVSEDKYYYWYVNATYGKNLTEIYSKVDGHLISDDYNLIVKSPNTLEIFPLGIDPDEDNLTYKYGVIDSPLDWSQNTFEGSPYYINGATDRRYVSGFVSDHLIGKDANLTVNAGSTANNTIMINVSDNEGLYDYQIINISVVG